MPGDPEAIAVVNGDEVDVLIGCEETLFVFCAETSWAAFVDTDRAALDDVTVVVVIETCAVAESVEGEIAPVVLDLAWKVGLLRARKAEKKFAKNGL